MLIWGDREGNCFCWQGLDEANHVEISREIRVCAQGRAADQKGIGGRTAVDYVQATFALRQHLATQCARWVSNFRLRSLSLRRTSRSTHPCVFYCSSFSDVQLHMRRRAKHEPGIHFCGRDVRAHRFSDVQSHIIVRAKKARPGMTEGAMPAATQSRTAAFRPDKPLALLHRWCSLERSYVLARYRHLPARVGNAGDNPVVLLHMAK